MTEHFKSTMQVVLFVFLILKFNFDRFACEERFEPITENIAFKVSYEVQAFINGEPSLLTEIQEQYQHNLASAKIEQLSYDGNTRQVSRRFIFNGESRRIIEIGDLSKDGANSKKPTILSEARQSFESVLLKLQTTDLMTQLNFDSFLTDNCLEKINKKLFYIKGITKLLNLIECRRKEIFLIDSKMQSDELNKITYTRNLKSRIYSSEKLLTLKTRLDDYSINSLSSEAIKSVKISVTIAHKDVSFRFDGDKIKENHLPSRIVPLSISLQFDQGILLVINIFQFDALDLMEHMSITQSGVVSDFLIPIGSGLSDVLFYSSSSFNENHNGKFSRRRKNVATKTQFSFRALLTGRDLPFLNPVELLVAYDSENKMLVREISITDRSISLGDGWKTHKSRLVYDGESFTKFHIKNSNEDYTENHFIDSQKTIGWQSCVTNSLSASESYILDGSSAASELFDLEGSTYMGIAEVRGIACYVYEKRVFRLPLWLGLGETEYSYLNEPTTIAAENEIYLTFYESMSDYVGENYEDEETERFRDSSTQNVYSTSRSKLIRLDINVIKDSKGANNNEGERSLLLNYILEMYSFDWSISLAHDELELFDISQECLLSNIHSKRVKLEISIEANLDEYNSRGFVLLKEDSKLCQDTVSRALSKSFPITKTEQVDLKTNIHSNSLQASLYVYEIPEHGFISKFMAYAQDLSLGSAAANSWETGATSISFHECEWRAAHTLEPVKLSNLANDNGIDYDEKTSRMFMFCPKTLHCVLGDSSWSLINERKSFSNRQIKYPVDTETLNRCIVTEVSAVRQSVVRHKNLRGKSLIEWLIQKGDERLIDTQIELKIEELSIATKTTNFKLSQMEKESFEVFVGVGYETVLGLEPLIAFNMAHCSHTCLMLHNCASYSVCHHQKSGAECIFTTIDWTEPLKANELRKKTVTTQTGFPLLIDVQLENNSTTQVKLKRSSLCNIYSQEHLSVFHHKENLLTSVGLHEHSQHAESIKDCAKFCLQRGNFFSNFRQTPSKSNIYILKGSQREFTCNSFMFDREKKICELKPIVELHSKKTLEYIESLIKRRENNQTRESAAAAAAAFGWKDSILKLRERIDSLPAFSEFEIYELNFAQLFEVNLDERLILTDEKEQLSSLSSSSSSSSAAYNELQVSIPDTGVEKCAKLCLTREGCRSFDIYTLTGGAQALIMKENTCVLNAYSINDISNLINNLETSKEDVKLPLKLQSSKRADQNTESGYEENKNDHLSRWFHYEPSELALHLIQSTSQSSSSPPDAQIVPTTTSTTINDQQQQQQQQQSGILIDNAQTSIYILPFIATTTTATKTLDVFSSSTVFHGSQPVGSYDNGKISNVNGVDRPWWNIAMAALFYCSLAISILLIVSINLYMYLFDRGSTNWKRLASCCSSFNFANRSPSQLFCNRR